MSVDYAAVTGRQGVRPAVAWGSEERVTELLGAGCRELRTARRTCPWRYPSAETCLAYFQTWYGPVLAAFTAVGDAGRGDLEAELHELVPYSQCQGSGRLPPGSAQDGWNQP